MTGTGLIDTKGRPLAANKAMAKELAAPTVDGVRSIWTETIISGLEPLILADILRNAANGFPDRFFLLAEEMEERDLHYRAVLSTRRLALTGIEPYVAAAGSGAAEKKQAEALSEVIGQAAFVDNCVSDMLDALAKGYSVVEIIWDKSPGEWRPMDFRWRNQRFFRLSREDGETLLLKTDDEREGIELEPYKFIIHKPKLKSGLPIRGGLARLAAWGFLFKNYTLKDWMGFLEVFGMPFRVGRYGASSSDEERRVLITALRDLSTDAAAIIPKEMEIEFIEAKGGAGNAVFASMAEYLDKQISKAVLGQTMTTDDGASLSQAKIHENVRHDIARADARQLAATLNRDLVRPFIDINFGRQEKYPEIIFPVREERDLPGLTAALEKLVPLGLRVAEKEVREELGLSEPQPDDILLLQTSQASPEMISSERNSGKAERSGLARMETGSLCACCDHERLALAASGGAKNKSEVPPTEEIENLADAAADNYEEVLGPVLRPLIKELQACQTYDQAEKTLNKIIGKLDMAPLAEKLAALQILAQGFKGAANGGK